MNESRVVERDQCTNPSGKPKIRHATQAEADTHADRLNDEFPSKARPFISYRCHRCGDWHVGRQEGARYARMRARAEVAESLADELAESLRGVNLLAVELIRLRYSAVEHAPSDMEERIAQARAVLVKHPTHEAHRG